MREAVSLCREIGDDVNCLRVDYLIQWRVLLWVLVSAKSAVRIAAALARFSTRHFAGSLLSVGMIWTQERLPAANADLLGGEAGERYFLGIAQGKIRESSGRTGGSGKGEEFLRASLREGGRLRGEGEDGPNCLHGGDGFRAGAKAQAQLAAEVAHPTR